MALSDVESAAAGQFLLFLGLPAAAIVLLAGIGIGGYFIGAAIGLAGAAAVGAGAGIILGGLLGLTLAGLGVWGLVVLGIHLADKMKQKKLQNESTVSKPDEIFEDSTKQILRAAASCSESELNAVTLRDESAPDADVAPKPKSSSPSIFAKIVGFFKRSKPSNVVPVNDNDESLPLLNK